MNYKQFISLFFVAFIYVSASAQTKKELRVAAAVDALRKAMIDPNKTTLENLVLDKLSYGHSSGALDTKTIFVEKLVSAQSDFVTIELTDQTIEITGPTAIVRHTLHATTNDGGKPGTVKLKVLLVWLDVKGEWKLLARQAVKI